MGHYRSALMLINVPTTSLCQMCCIKTDTVKVLQKDVVPTDLPFIPHMHLKLVSVTETIISISLPARIKCILYLKPQKSLWQCAHVQKRKRFADTSPSQMSKYIQKCLWVDLALRLDFSESSPELRFWWNWTWIALQKVLFDVWGEWCIWIKKQNFIALE